MYSRIVCGLVVALALASLGAAKVPSDEAVVRDFYRLLCDERRVQDAYAAHVAADYVEHSSDVPGGGRAASIAYMEGLLATTPNGRVEVIRSASERGLVFLHSRFMATPTAVPVAIVEIFRVSGGKIVEHWDIVKPTPETPVNPVSPF